jgi:hypothetical protein
MPERKRRLRIFLLHATLLVGIVFVFSFFLLSPRQWAGVDEAVVEKIAGEHGRQARPSLLETKGDALLLIFLLAGVVGGFAAGYHWKALTGVKRGPNDER